MRVKRTTILASLLVSMLASVGFGLAALSDGESSDTVFAGQAGNAPVAPAPAANDPGLNNQIETRDGSLGGYFLWLGALVSMIVLLVSTVLFRVEVSKEKELVRARAQRREYHRDLRRYQAQMEGPNRDNT